jgi:hypothetical protein
VQVKLDLLNKAIENISNQASQTIDVSYLLLFIKANNLLPQDIAKSAQEALEVIASMVDLNTLSEAQRVSALQTQIRALPLYKKYQGTDAQLELAPPLDLIAGIFDLKTIRQKFSDQQGCFVREKKSTVVFSGASFGLEIEITQDDLQQIHIFLNDLSQITPDNFADYTKKYASPLSLPFLNALYIKPKQLYELRQKAIAAKGEILSTLSKELATLSCSLIDAHQFQLFSAKVLQDLQLFDSEIKDNPQHVGLLFKERQIKFVKQELGASHFFLMHESNSLASIIKRIQLIQKELEDKMSLQDLSDVHQKLNALQTDIKALNYLSTANEEFLLNIYSLLHKASLCFKEQELLSLDLSKEASAQLELIQDESLKDFLAFKDLMQVHLLNQEVNNLMHSVRILLRREQARLDLQSQETSRLQAELKQAQLQFKQKYLPLLAQLAQEIEKKYKLESDKYQKVRASIQLLESSLDTHCSNFFAKPATALSFKTFQTSCVAAIDKAELECKNHRQLWHQLDPIFKAILGLVATLMIIPALVVASIFGYGNTFFNTPQTASAKALLEFKAKFDECGSALVYS